MQFRVESTQVHFFSPESLSFLEFRLGISFSMYRVWNRKEESWRPFSRVSESLLAHYCNREKSDVSQSEVVNVCEHWLPCIADGR